LDKKESRRLKTNSQVEKEIPQVAKKIGQFKTKTAPGGSGAVRKIVATII